MRIPTPEQVRAARAAFEDDFTLAEFYPWPFEPILEFLEQALPRRKAGLKEIEESGLAHAFFGEEAKDDIKSSARPLILFRFARILANRMHLILDRVERDPAKTDPARVEKVLSYWNQHLKYLNA